MLTPNFEITIGANIFTYVMNFNINENADLFTRTASIFLPQKFYENSMNNIFDLIAIGDTVEIKTGFYPNLQTRFKGYVSKRVPNSPLEVQCEDESFIYKQTILEPLTLENTTLGDFIGAIYSGKTEIFEPDRKIGTWRIAKSTTFLKVLDNLRQTFGLSAFWDNDGVLYIDKQLDELSELKGAFYYDTVQANILDISNMTFQEAAEFNQVVKGISLSEDLGTDGKPKEPITVYSYFDTKGKIKTTDQYNAFGNINEFKLPYLTKDELTKLCEIRLQNINFTGYRGTFKTWGEPIVNVNDDLEIYNNRQKEMQGRYRVKGVTINGGLNGYYQEIEVSKKTGEIN